MWSNIFQAEASWLLSTVLALMTSKLKDKRSFLPSKAPAAESLTHSLLNDFDFRCVLVNPALVVGADVVPSWLELVAHGPHEVSLDVAVEDVHDAASEASNLVVGIEVRVYGASAVLNGRVVAGQSSGAERSKILSGAVKVDSVLVQVGVGALDALASASSVGVGIVEATKPESAHVGGEGPLTNPHVVLEVKCVADGTTVLVAVGADVFVLAAPGEVLVSVHHDVLMIIVVKEIVPGVWIEVEGVVEDELDARLLILDHGSHVSVELLQSVDIR